MAWVVILLIFMLGLMAFSALFMCGVGWLANAIKDVIIWFFPHN